MSLPRLRTAIVMAATLTAISSTTAPGQVRRIPTQPPTEPSPGYQPPGVDPVAQKLGKLQIAVESLRQSVGRQIVVLHFAPLPSTSWVDADNTFPKNNQRAEAICKEALGDRYGRVVSRKTEPDATLDRTYFPNVVCETKP